MSETMQYNTKRPADGFCVHLSVFEVSVQRTVLFFMKK